MAGILDILRKKERCSEMPKEGFWTYNDGEFQLEPPENYQLYTDIGPYDCGDFKVGSRVGFPKNEDEATRNRRQIAGEIAEFLERYPAIVIVSGAEVLGRRISGAGDINGVSPEARLRYVSKGMDAVFALWEADFRKHGVGAVTHLVTQEEAANGMPVLLEKLGNERDGKHKNVILVNEHDIHDILKYDVGAEDRNRMLGMYGAQDDQAEYIDGIIKRLFGDNDVLQGYIGATAKKAGYFPVAVNVASVPIFRRVAWESGDPEQTLSNKITIIRYPGRLEEQASGVRIGSTGKGGLESKVYLLKMLHEAGIYAAVVPGPHAPHPEDCGHISGILKGWDVGTRSLPAGYVTASMNGHGKL